MNPNHRVVSSRATLAATVAGSGDPLVFLHAGVCDSRMLDARKAGVSRSMRPCGTPLRCEPYWPRFIDGEPAGKGHAP
jgi:hypothetical protein